jgi:flagellar motor switch protein FliG
MKMHKKGLDAYQKSLNKAAPTVTDKNKKVANPKTLPNLPYKVVADDMPAKTGKRKSAELLLMMGKEEAANVLKHMPIADVEQVMRELAELKSLKQQDINNTLASFEADKPLIKGGSEVAEGFLRVAFGNEEGERLLKRAMPNEKPFGFLENLTIDNLVALLKNESIETLAVILPRIKASLAKEVLKNVDAPYQGDLVRRIAQSGKINVNVIERIEAILKERLKQQEEKPEQVELDGPKALAQILRYMSNSEAAELVKDLPASLTGRIDEYIFTSERLAEIADRDFQEILRDLNEHEIALLLKGQSDSVREKFMKNLSEGKRNLIKKEEQILPPMRKSEVDKIMREFLDRLKELERQGHLTLIKDNEEFI